MIAKALNVSLDWLCGLSDIPSIESESKQIPIDVATLLRAIAEFTVNHKSGTIAISSLSDYLNEDDREYFSQDYKIGSLIIISDRISAFLDDLIQLKALSDSGILAGELFDMCVKQLVLRTAKQIEKDEKVS